MRRPRTIAAVVVAVVAALSLQAGPALAGHSSSRASGVCGGTEIPPGSDNC